MMTKNGKMTETMADWYSFDSTQGPLSNEYQNDRVKMISLIFRCFEHWTKVTSTAKGLNTTSTTTLESLNA